jgi:hypothetical protein
MKHLSSVSRGMRQLFFVPSGRALESYTTELWKRYTDQATLQDPPPPAAEAAERALAYIDRIIDRQISKSNGVLTFNSVLIALLALEDKRIFNVYFWHIGFAAGISILLLISSFIILLHFWIHWEINVTLYGSFAPEFKRAARLASRRSKALMWSVAISIFCVWAIGGVMFAPELIKLSTSGDGKGPQSAMTSLSDTDVRQALAGLFLDRIRQNFSDARMRTVEDRLSDVEKAQRSSQPRTQLGPEELDAIRSIAANLQQLSGIIERSASTATSVGPTSTNPSLATPTPAALPKGGAKKPSH